MITLVRTHTGPTRSLSKPDPDRTAFTQHGLVLLDRGCVTLTTRLERLESCALPISPDQTDRSR